MSTSSTPATSGLVAGFGVPPTEDLGLPFDQSGQWGISYMWGWQAFLLPEMDQAVVDVNFRTAKDVDPNLRYIQITVEPYICPTTDGALEGRPGNLGWSTYRAAVGTTANNGMMFMNSDKGDKDCRDGTSSTLLFGEARFGFWGDALSCCARVPQMVGTDQNRNVFDWNSGPLDFDNGNAIFAYFSFGSFHDGVVNFVMVDGSTKQISKTIDKRIMNALATRNGHEAIDEY